MGEGVKDMGKCVKDVGEGLENERCILLQQTQKLGKVQIKIKQRGK
jgi:hypothetical protein